jgi:hypothetical protein
VRGVSTRHAMSSIDPLTNGIQDLSALLPLLGTEQCEEHVASGLTKGFLYSAAAPISIFGSLGVAKAGFKTFLAALELDRISGAGLLRNMGFGSAGMNLELILLDEQSEESTESKSRRFAAATRLDSTLKELHIKDPSQVSLESNNKRWLIVMTMFSAFFAIISMAPYLHFAIHHKGNNRLSLALCWTFPALKALGGFLASTITPIILQIRILQISRQHLEGVRTVGGRHVMTAKLPVHTILFALAQFLLIVGCIALCVGYVGCFLVVQGSTLSNGALIWLGAEVGLALVRMGLWAFNPKMDDATPLDIQLRLPSDKLLPTCFLCAPDIASTKTLPLTRDSDFLEQVTAYAGLLNPFNYPNVTLYYTLASKNRVTENEGAECILYITMLEHAERTVRVFYNDDSDGVSTTSIFPQSPPNLTPISINTLPQNHLKST